MNTSIHHLRQFQLLSDWYLSVLEGISDDDGNKTISDNQNSLAWLAGHLITGRYRNLVRLGVDVEPYKHLDKFINQTLPPPNAIAFDKAINYPSLTTCREQWIIYTNLLLERLKTIDEASLKKEVPFPILTGGNTVEDMLNFVALHESFHVGQMSIMRKYLGYPSMMLGPRK